MSIQDTHIKGSPPTSSHYIVSPEATPLSLDSGFRRNDEQGQGVSPGTDFKSVPFSSSSPRQAGAQHQGVVGGLMARLAAFAVQAQAQAVTQFETPAQAHGTATAG